MRSTRRSFASWGAPNPMSLPPGPNSAKDRHVPPSEAPKAKSKAVSMAPASVENELPGEKRGGAGESDAENAGDGTSGAD